MFNPDENSFMYGYLVDLNLQEDNRITEYLLWMSGSYQLMFL